MSIWLILASTKKNEKRQISYVKNKQIGFSKNKDNKNTFIYICFISPKSYPSFAFSTKHKIVLSFGVKKKEYFDY